MSHFTVLVIGKRPEKQLAPFDENLEVSEFLVGDIEADELERFIAYYTDAENNDINKLHFSLVDGIIWQHQPGGTDSIGITVFELYALKGKNWNDKSWRLENGKFVEYSTRNPNAKWDWYSLGGRWTGYFKLKEGATGESGEPGILTAPAERGWADQLLKKDIDIPFMRNYEAEKAAKRYDEAMEVIEGTPVPESWDVIRERFGDKINEARDFYWAQPRMAAWHNSDKFGPFTDPEQFSVTREQYVKTAEDGALATFAVIMNGKWYEKGKMGWWGMVSDEKEQDKWNTEFTAMFDALPDDTLISLYDCHI